MNNIEFVGEHTRTFHVTRHRHASWELVYCTDGMGSFAFDNGLTINYKAGEAVAIPPELAHANDSAGGFTNIHVRMGDVIFPENVAFRVADDLDGHMNAAFRQAKFFYLLDINGGEMILSALGDLIISYMTAFRISSGVTKPVEVLRTLILNNYTVADFALEDAIRALPFHYDYTRKLFKKEIGITPLEYMTQLRMKKAAAMLAISGTGEYTISDIAHTCGFGDALYFSRVFKKHYGLCPSAYALEHRAEDDLPISVL